MLNLEIDKGLKSEFLKEEYFTTWDFNYQSEVHSRVQPLIIKVCHDLEFEVEVERGFNYYDDGKKVRFKPDVVAYKNKAPFALIEYESTNSSDARFYEYDRTSDLKCLERYTISNPDNLPLHWIIISTLPKMPVNPKRWGSWDYNKSNPEFKKVVNSPFEYYFPTYEEETLRVLEKIKTKLKVYLLNLDKNTITLEKEF